MLHKPWCRQVGEMSEGTDRHGVAEERDAGCDFTVDFYFPCRRAYKADFAGNIVVEQPALLLCELGAHPQQVLFFLAHHVRIGVGAHCLHLCLGRCQLLACHVVASDFVRKIGGKPGFGIFVEAFEQRNPDGVAELPIILHINSIIGVEVGVFPEFKILGGV